MDQISKRMVLILAVNLLLQLFALAAYAAKLNKGKATYVKLSSAEWEENYEADENQDSSQGAERRNILGSFIGSYALKSLNFIAKVTSKLAAATDIGLTIAQSIKGCGAFYPSLNKNWNKYQELDAKFRNISKQIREANAKASIQQIYANSSYYEYRNTRDVLRKIADEQERVFLSMGSKPKTKLQTLADEIENNMKQHNSSKQDIDLLKIDKKLTRGLDLALELVFPSLSLAWPGIKKITNYIKGTIVGEKINKIEAAIGRKITARSNTPIKSRKIIMSNRLMKSSFGLKLQQLRLFAKHRYRRVYKAIKKVKLGMKSLLKLGAAALQVWSVFMKIKNCKDAAEKSADSVKQMRKFVEQNEEFLSNITTAYAEVQEVYEEIRDTAWNQFLLEAIEKVQNMMVDQNIAKKTEESGSITQAIQAYIDAKDINATSMASKQRLNQIQRNLNVALFKVPFTLSCHSIKGVTFEAVKFNCAEGEIGSLKQVYESVKRTKSIDENVAKCKYRTGELYISLENMKKAWEKWVSTNKTVDSICLKNNPFVVEGVKEEIQNGETDAEIIAKKVNKPKSVDDIKTIMEEFQKDPRIMNALPPIIQNQICLAKTLTSQSEDDQFQIAKAMIKATNSRRDITKEDLRKQKCDNGRPITD